MTGPRNHPLGRGRAGGCAPGVGVQVGVARAAIPVGERARDQPVHVHLAYPVGAGAAKQRVLFDEGQRVAHRGPVGLFDLRRNDRLGERPERRHALNR